MLTKEQMKEIKDELMSAEKPLFFFHDDADGLASFLQFYKLVNKGKWIIVKSTPHINDRFLKTAKEYNPDKIFILDVAMLDQDFVDSMNKKIIWVDHHDLAEIKGVKYYNPKQNSPKSVTCVSKLSYDVFQDNFWLAAVGTIGDWQLPTDIREKINKDMPDLFSEDIKEPAKALFESKIGSLAKLFSFILKGETKEIYGAIKAMVKIKDPKEILEQSTEEGAFLYRRFMHINKEYEALLSDATKKADNSNVLVFTYQENKTSLSGELSNELLYRYPDKIIVIARHHNGEMKTSFRSGKNLKVREILEKAMIGVEGRFGGHEHACGGLIKDHDWEKLIKNLRDIVG